MHAEVLFLRLLFSGVLIVWLSKKLFQSYIGTTVGPSLVLTSCATLGVADWLTPSIVSSRQLILYAQMVGRKS